MATFIHLTSPNLQILGKLRFNVENIIVIIPAPASGHSIVLSRDAFKETVKESPDQIDKLIEQEGGRVVKKPALTS